MKYEVLMHELRRASNEVASWPQWKKDQIVLRAPQKTTVVHVKQGCDVYIGRDFRGYKDLGWGNPFKLTSDEDRGATIARYREWIKTQPDLLARLPELKGKRLGCWCKPFHSCHGDVLAELANNLTEETP